MSAFPWLTYKLLSKQDNKVSNNNKVFLTRVIITNDDIQGFIKEIPEYSYVKTKDPIIMDIYI